MTHNQSHSQTGQPLSEQEKQQLTQQIEQAVARHPHADQLGDGSILKALLPIVLQIVEQFLLNRPFTGGQPAPKPAA